MSPDIHRQMTAIAGDISSDLHAELEAIGLIAFPDRRRHGLPYFLARAIVGQQLSIKAARSIWNRIEQASKEAGSRVPDFFQTTNKDAIARCGVSGNKIKALISIREARDNKQLSVRRLKSMSTSERAGHLQAIWGIGPWTADMVSIFYFNDPDIWPDEDVTVQKTFRNLICHRDDLTQAEAAALFAPYRSFLALYMWRIVDGTR